MSASIDGKIYSLREKSWHGLDRISETPLPSSEVIKLAGVDFQVEKKPIYIESTLIGDTSNATAGLESHKIIPAQFATVRTDKDIPLGVVGSRYEVVQNSEAFKFFDSVIGEEFVQYETAGSLNEGRQIFVTAKLKEGMQINGKDEHDLYLIFTNDHTGGSPLRVLLSSIRVVCWNTFTAAINSAKSSKNVYSIRHVKNAVKKIEEAKTVLKIAKTYFEEEKQFFESISKKYIPDAEVQKMLQQMICEANELEKLAKGATLKDALSTRKLNIYNKIWDAYTTPASQQNIIGTGYGFLNGITYYTSHMKNDDLEDSVDSHLFGSSRQLQQDAVRFLLV